MPINTNEDVSALTTISGFCSWKFNVFLHVSSPFIFKIFHSFSLCAQPSFPVTPLATFHENCRLVKKLVLFLFDRGLALAAALSSGLKSGDISWLRYADCQDEPSGTYIACRGDAEGAEAAAPPTSKRVCSSLEVDHHWKA